MNINQELQDKIKILKQRGAVLTTPRLIILEFLLKNRIHPTAEDVCNALKERILTCNKYSLRYNKTLCG
jgi:Fe2+ or Zn2+ uptake regulation protein